MRITIRTCGNSAAIRIPASVMAAARLTLGQAVEVRAEDGRIIIEPAAPDLASLVAAITEDNLHDSLDTGAPRGREAW